MATSQTFTLRQSLLTRYFPFLVKDTEEILETASKSKFLCRFCEEVDL
jgi:hypothetical protein